MAILLTVIHVTVAFFLVIVVLLQSGKAADLAGAFGGMGSQTAFGPRGAATVLSKATTIAAILFMLTSISLGIVKSRTQGVGESVIERIGVGVEEEAGTDSGEEAADIEIPQAPEGEAAGETDEGDSPTE